MLDSMGAVWRDERHGAGAVLPIQKREGRWLILPWVSNVEEIEEMGGEGPGYGMLCGAYNA